MRMHPFHRTELLLGQAGFHRVQEASACVVGLGGVGSYAAEALARCGIGHLTLVDFDRVCITNLNRQLHATRKTAGQQKVALMEERVRAIHPKCDVRTFATFFDASTAAAILDRPYDAVLDCIDNMKAKVELLAECVVRGQPVLSSMGAGGRLDPTRVRVTDISKTVTDPFARIARDLLRERGITKGIQCVWTDEPPVALDPVVEEGFRCICPDVDERTRHSCEERFQVQGTVSWMPAIFGLTMAGTLVNELAGKNVSDGHQPKKRPRQKPAPNRLPAARRKELTDAARTPSDLEGQ